jgi:hypothetical protein
MRSSSGIAGVLMFLGLAVAAVAGGQQGDTVSTPGSGVIQVTAVERQAADAMSVLRTRRTADDAMAPDAAERLGERASFGMNPTLSRRAIANIAHSVYIVPANDYVCGALTVGDGAAMSCTTTADLAAGRSHAATATLEGGAIGIYGLVSDGVESVTVATGDADTSTASTENNAYFAAVPKGTVLRNISYTGASGQVEFPIYDPALAFKDD